MSDKLNVGERIKARRLELGITQEELARRMGLTNRATVCHAERDTGEQMTSKTLANYARALHCSPVYLMGLTDDPEPLNEFYLTDEEQKLIIEYRKAPEHDRQMIRRLLAYYEGLNK